MSNTIFAVLLLVLIGVLPLLTDTLGKVFNAISKGHGRAPDP